MATNEAPLKARPDCAACYGKGWYHVPGRPMPVECSPCRGAQRHAEWQAKVDKAHKAREALRRAKLGA